MIQDKDKALKIADFLLQIKAVKLQPSDPFTWSSGWKSPIYCDNRKTLSHPLIRTSIRQTFSEQIAKAYGNVEAIAGVATGAIAIGALVAEEMGLPFIYVRDKVKGHGMTNKIEGEFHAGQRIVVIEDLISTGKSSLKAVQALREAELNVLGLTAIFTYEFDAAVKAFEKENCSFFTLSDYTHMIEQAVNQKYISESDIQSLQEWRLDPKNWNK